MEWLNYHHLLYFWTAAREGSIARACEKLLLAQPTVSGQIKRLEDSLGEKLFEKAGRGLALTETGRVVYAYAEEIFGLGRELQNVLRGKPGKRPARLLVGVSDMLPKLIAYRILEPAMRLEEPVQLICQEDTPEGLLLALADHKLDVVISDTPVGTGARVKAYNHLLGSCPAVLFAAPPLAKMYRKGFPACLEGAPFLLPMDGSRLRRSLDQWFDSQNVRPRVVGEFKDSALMKTFGEAGAGVFVAPAAIEAEVKRRYSVARIGVLPSVVETFYVISVERRIKHPAVIRISETARDGLFARSGAAD
jgi:LysR family transcriptional activator of nhaA